MIYIKIKLLHSVLALASIGGFVLRGYWMATESAMLQHRVTRVAPHVIDTMLLLAGVSLLYFLALNPFTQAWLATKFLGLFAYIVLGSFAIKRGKTKQVRMISFVAAVAVYFFIIGVALAKSPIGWLALLERS